MEEGIVEKGSSDDTMRKVVRWAETIAPNAFKVTKERAGVENSFLPGVFEYDKSGILMKKLLEYNEVGSFLLKEFNYWINKVLPMQIEAGKLVFKNGSYVTFSNVKYTKPTYQDPQTGKLEELTIQMAHERDLSYTFGIYADRTHFSADKTVLAKQESQILTKLPVMVGSELCHLYGKTPKEILQQYQCTNDPFGWFITNGVERVIVIQEKLAANKVQVFPDNKKSGKLIAKITCMTLRGSTIVRLEQGLKGDVRINLHFLGQEKTINVFSVFRILGMDSVVEILNLIKTLTIYPREVINALQATIFEFNQFRDLNADLENIKSTVNRTNFDPKFENIVNLVKSELFPQISVKDEASKTQRLRHLNTLNMVKKKKTAEELRAMRRPPRFQEKGEKEEEEEEEPKKKKKEKKKREEEKEEEEERKKEKEEEKLDDDEKKRRDEIKKRQELKNSCYDKLRMLAFMLIRFVETLIGKRDMDNRDSWSNKRLASAAKNLERLFSKSWHITLDRIQSEITEDKITTFTQVAAQLDSYSNKITNEFVNSFSGNSWGIKGSYVKENITQTLDRKSPIIAVYSNILKITIPTSKKAKLGEIRELQGTQVNFVCVTETSEGANCLREGTPILIADGTTLPIEEVCSNQNKVISVDPQTCEKSLTEIKNPFHFNTDEKGVPMLRIKLSNGKYVDGTGDHPFLTQRGWINLKDINALKDKILYHTNDSRISMVEYRFY